MPKWFGTSRCGACEERFMGEPDKMVTLKDDPKHKPLIIHTSCFDQKVHQSL